MNTSNLRRYMVRLCACSMLAGCAQAPTAVNPLGVSGSVAHAGSVVHSDAARLPWSHATFTRRDHGRSWMLADAKGKDLVYVSDEGTMDVYAYSYPDGTLEGTLTGFVEPGGLCADAKGRVFITDVFASTIAEYAHGAANPTRTLSDRHGRLPNGCAVDPVTGNLAVTDFGSDRGCGMEGCSRGEVAIYRGARGRPAYHRAMFHPYECGYDAQGNLFVDGMNKGLSTFAFGELPRSGAPFVKIQLNQSFGIPGGVRWDGTDVAVGDVYGSVIYRFAIDGAAGTEVGSTPLSGTDGVWDFWLQNGIAIAPNANQAGSGSSSNVLLYDYPSGGTPVGTIGGNTVEPVSAAVSLAH